MRVLSIAFWGAVGCNSVSEACLDYTDAAEACFSTASDAGLQVDVDTEDPEGFCQQFETVLDATWTCEAAAFRGGDCTTDAGLAAVTTAREACQ